MREKESQEISVHPYSLTQLPIVPILNIPFCLNSSCSCCSGSFLVRAGPAVSRRKEDAEVFQSLPQSQARKQGLSSLLERSPAGLLEARQYIGMQQSQLKAAVTLIE